MTTIDENLNRIHNKIQIFEQRYHRTPHSVTLLAVSKNASLEKIQQAINAQQFAFGESYLQEALPKIHALRNKNLVWHFLGPIQSNKTRKIAENFSWVHSVDSLKIAKRLSKQRPIHLPRLNILLQVNVSLDPHKSGVLPTDAIPLAKELNLLPNLALRGLMTLPKASKEFQEQCDALQQLKQLYDQCNENDLSFDTLSMGMSDDMEAAIAVGSTMVRIGTAIFKQNIS